jgi:protein-S-isoprenylcysteine O-methyltransferase Ste14
MSGRSLPTAWGGAGVFLASLGYCSWFYLVRLREPEVAAGSTATAVTIDVALFSVFALHHSIFARSGARAWVAARLPSGLERSCYVWIASLLLLAVCLLWQPLAGVAWEATGVTRWLLYGVQLCGLLLTLRSASRIDIWELAGVRQAHITEVQSTEVASPSATVLEASPMLQTDGAYRWVRHPIYFGWVLMVFGAPAMTASRLLFAAISTLYLIVAIPFEERSLGEEFGPAYRDYQRKVRWRLVPGIW